MRISGANIHDKWGAIPTVDDAARHAPGEQRRPEHCCLDKGYDYQDVERGLKRRRIIPHIRRRGEPPLIGCVKGKPRRWVIERTNAWHNAYRGLRTRWETKGCNYLALCQLACGFIAFQQALRR